METKPISREKINQLIQKGVMASHPATIDIGDEVNPDQISGKDVKIYPGCRIYGSKTVISAGSRLGAEAPVTMENCRLGRMVELKGGYFKESVFLDGVSLGMGAHVREGCLLEEQASTAHSVGLKQTILFPFVTLGSLINFCDCLMAGGTSRQNHSEVGSSYIHFNFTPDGDKATPSLLGDVPRGVMLNQPPIFLGGQGGLVGPLRLGYGNVVSAGSILRRDYPEDGQLISGTAPAGGIRIFKPATYPHFRRLVENNIFYLANLKALAAWYALVRKPFLEAEEFGALLCAGAEDQLRLARKERLNRLGAMARKAAAVQGIPVEDAGDRQMFIQHLSDIEELTAMTTDHPETRQAGEIFLEDFRKYVCAHPLPYLQAIQNLPADIATRGVSWLEGIVRDYCLSVAAVMPPLGLFKNFKATTE